MSAKALITPQFEAHFNALSRSVFSHAVCPPSGKVVPSHDGDVEVTVEYLEDKGAVTAYCTICRMPGGELLVSYISLCGMSNEQPVLLAQFDTFDEYLAHCSQVLNMAHS